MPANLLSRLRRKFLLEPAGYGRPLSKETLDGEYRGGAWSQVLQPRPPQPQVAKGTP